MVNTLAATVLYGGLNFLFKMAAEKGYEADRLVNIVGLTVAVLALATLSVTSRQPLALFTRPVMIYALFNGFFFALGSLAKMGALKRAPAAIVFSLNRFNTVLVMLVGVAVFHEVPRPLQMLGMVTGLGVLALITFEHRADFRASGDRTILLGGAWAVGSAVFTALSMTVGKLLAESSSNRLAYICVSYALVFLFTLGKQSVARRGVTWIPELLDAKLCLYGAGIGVLNFAGYFLVLQAFGSGPISLSQAIFSSSILIPILLSRLLYHEKLTPMRLAAIGLAILSVVLISLK